MRPHLFGGSIRSKLILWGLLVPIPLILLLFVQHFYATYVVRNQVAESNSNMLSLYMGQIDQNLRSADEFLVSLSAQDADLPYLDTFRDPNENELARIRIGAKLSENIPRFPILASMFVYSQSTDTFIDVNNADRTYEDRQEMRRYVRSAIENGGVRTADDPGDRHKWQTHRIGSKHYLLRMISAGNVTVGAWADINKILTPLSLINLGKTGTSLIVGTDGRVFAGAMPSSTISVDLSRGFAQPYLSGSRSKYLVIGKPSVEGDFALVAVIADSEILQNLPYFERVMTPIAAFSLLVIPIGLLILRRSVIEPLGRIVKAMEKVQEGDLELRIAAHPVSNELIAVNETFNRMVERIRELKIDVYEKQIEKQQAELQYLQLQIKPHFFLNALNIIYQLAQVHNFTLIQELTMSLVKHFRYMFKSEQTLVTLDRELDHVRNYGKIHEARFPNGHACNIRVPAELLAAEIPPFTIQTFVENALKHGGIQDGPIVVDIDARSVRSRTGAYLVIEVTDNGRGFSDQALRSFSDSDRVGGNGLDGISSAKAAGDHIGIINVRRRLAALFHGEASVECANREPRGASVTIRIPIAAEGIASSDSLPGRGDEPGPD